MTGEEFMQLYLGDRELRQFIVDTAKGRSKRKCIQEEFVQEAWLAVSCAPAGYCTEAYFELVQAVIYSAYWQVRKEYMVGDSVEITYSRNPFDHWETIINHKTPVRGSGTQHKTKVVLPGDFGETT